MVGNDTGGLYAINPIAEQSIYKKNSQQYVRKPLIGQWQTSSRRLQLNRVLIFDNLQVQYIGIIGIYIIIYLILYTYQIFFVMYRST